MNPLVIIAGPTAVGKSALGVKLAKRINGEIISADSMQVYRGMDIGTAKITKEETEGIKHYLIDVLNPDEEFNVYTFQMMAKEAVAEITAKGKVPIVVGGTGFYTQALLYDIDFTESEGLDNSYRESLQTLYEENGADYLFDMLKKVDPASCEIIHKNNIKKVIRALDFYHETGKPISSHNTEQAARPAAFNFAYFFLNDDRDKVYERIDKRVDKMASMGLADEVKGLREKGYDRGMISMLGLGYKEILDYLDGNISLSEALNQIKQGTRKFSKRQVTWAKRENDVIWLNRPEYKDDEEILEFICKTLKEKEII